jgi:hypothetical protein
MKTDRNSNHAQDHRVPAFHCDSSENAPALRSKMATIASCLFVMVLAAGCASAKVTNQEQLVTGQLPRPAHILVNNFVATASDLPADSVLVGEPDVDTTPPSAEQAAEGRKLGA